MRCEGCFREISIGAIFCPYCGEDQKPKNSTIEDKEIIIQDENEVDIINDNDSQKQPITLLHQSNAKQALVFGSFSLVSGFFSGIYLNIICLTLGVLAIVYGLKTLKHIPSRSTWGIILGGLGLTLVLTQGLMELRHYLVAMNLQDKYSEELDINIPDVKPIKYYFYEKGYIIDFDGIEVGYQLSDEQMVDFFSQIDHRWLQTPFNNDIIDFINSLDNLYFTWVDEDSGYYLIYDYLEDAFSTPGDSNEFHFVIVFLSTDDNTLWIIEVWK